MFKAKLTVFFRAGVSVRACVCVCFRVVILKKWDTDFVTRSVPNRKWKERFSSVSASDDGCEKDFTVHAYPYGGLSIKSNMQTFYPNVSFPCSLAEVFLVPYMAFRSTSSHFEPNNDPRQGLSCRIKDAVFFSGGS